MSYTKQCSTCGGWLDGERSDMACDCFSLRDVPDWTGLTEIQAVAVRHIIREELERARGCSPRHRTQAG